MPIYREYSSLDDDDPVLKPGQTLRVPLRFVDSATRAQWNALHSTPIMFGAQQLHDGMGNAPGFKRGFVFGGDRSASEAAREQRIREMQNAWGKERNSPSDNGEQLSAQDAAADAYEQRRRWLQNAWRQR
jgi:hypothetical protein